MTIPFILGPPDLSIHALRAGGAECPPQRPRLLTREEAGLVEQAAEHWLRLRDVEINAGEYAAGLLRRSQFREQGCTRQDVATLGRTILLQVPGEQAPVPIQLVRPADEDLWSGRVSIVSDLGLACVGKVLGSEVRVPRGIGRFVGFADGRADAAADSRESADASA